MDVFQSPLEALAINYVSFEHLPTVQSIFTCVAIVTAAISFWRIRAVGSISYHRTKSSAHDYPSSVHDAHVFAPPPLPVSTWSEPKPEPDSEPEKEKAFHQEEQACSSFVGVGVGAIEYDDSDDRVIKDKFTLYYDDENANTGGEEDPIRIGDDSDDGVDVVCFYRKEPYYSNGRLWSCDGIWMGRGGDFGWYRSQDLTMLNGNVVRLWDCQRPRC